MFSVKMRSSRGGKNGSNGKHISGAEKIVHENELKKTIIDLFSRARSHERGKADFINLKIQEFDESESRKVPALKIHSKKTASKEEGRNFAREELVRSGVSPLAADNALCVLESLVESMRGAMIFDSKSGERLDSLGERGVRCSNMDAFDKDKYRENLSASSVCGEHAWEALILASKVASAPGSVAELCWSDDPNYVTGYVSSSKIGYTRISVMKDYGNDVGGRVFFVKSGTNLEEYIDYLQNQVVLVEA